MINSRKSLIRRNGFSLIELAIVLLIVALLLGGLLPTLSSQIEQQHRNETLKQLEEVKIALIGYALANGRLPCPADATIPSGQTNAGLEATTGSGATLTCTNLTGGVVAWGVLPRATLGTSETDAWGKRFTYRVTHEFADAIGLNTYGGTCTPAIPPLFSSFALCSDGNLTVRTTSIGGTIIADKIPAVIISHGANGFGAYLPTGLQFLPIPPANTDEIDNTDTNTIFVSHENSPTFDDLLVLISPNILYNRMVSAGKLP